MPLELHVIRASEFVCLDPDEQLNFEESKKTLQTLAHACKKRGLDRALLDLRALQIPAKPLFTPTQLAALIGTFREAGFGRQQKLAVLYRTDPHGGVRTFAFIGRIQGWQVRAFDEFEAAFHWLSEETIRRSVRGEAEVPISINKRQSEVKKLPVSLPARSPAMSVARPVRRMPGKHA
jgi:hypothetical protein